MRGRFKLGRYLERGLYMHTHAHRQVRKAGWAANKELARQQRRVYLLMNPMLGMNLPRTGDLMFEVVSASKNGVFTPKPS